MSAAIPDPDGALRLPAVFGDPVAQVQTPRLANPLFARHGLNLFAVPFHVTRESLQAAWKAFAAGLLAGTPLGKWRRAAGRTPA